MISLGGTGLGVRFLYERMKPKEDPLGPENILGFFTSPLTATPTPEMVKVTLPPSVGPAAGAKIDFEALKRGYFKAMGWDIKTGKTYRQTPIDLGL